MDLVKQKKRFQFPKNAWSDVSSSRVRQNEGVSPAGRDAVKRKSAQSVYVTFFLYIL